MAEHDQPGDLQDPAPAREQPELLCYCFGFSRVDVLRELAETGSCSVPERIAAEMKARGCSCKTKNPAGVCCLAEVRRFVEETQSK